jgi:GT2 family glycosyltransferase
LHAALRRRSSGTAVHLPEPTPEPRVSVIIPTVRVNANLHDALRALAAQTYRNFDVYIVTDEPESRAIDGLAVTFLASGPLMPNAKRRQAAQASTAGLVALIDDDAFPAPDWLHAAVGHFADPQVVAVGGPGLTPLTDPPAMRASGAVFASPLVSAGEVRRYVPRAGCDVHFLPTCNLIVRRDPFLTAVATSVQYFGGEDLLLCVMLEQSGRIVYDPAVVVFHHRRPLFWGHFRQIWNYAVHRGYFGRQFRAARDPRYFVPLVFLAAHAGLIALPLAPKRLRAVGLALCATYAGLLVLEARRARREFDADPLLVAAGIYLTHLVYGAGVARGLIARKLDQ